MNLHIPLPDFEGPYYLETTDGMLHDVNLIGAFMGTNGVPIYLQTVEGEVYNFQNVISFKKRPKV
jgi:hypothetical protein